MKFIIALILVTFCFNSIAMERSIDSAQRGVRALSFKVASDGTDSGLDSLQVASSKSATGTYVMALNKPFVRDVTAHVTAKTTTCAVKSVTETTSSVTVVMAAADLATNKDCAFNILILGSDIPDKF